MTQEVLKLALEALKIARDQIVDPEYAPIGWSVSRLDETLDIMRKALAQPEQEPVAWLLIDKNINSLQVDSIQRLIDRLKHAHHTDLCVRINGQDEWFQADWLKHIIRVTPPQPEQELVAWRTFDGEGGYDYCSYEHNESYADDWDKRNPNHKGWVDALYTKEKNNA